MALNVATTHVVTVNSVDVSDHCTAVEVTDTADEIDSTNFGSGGNRERLGGLGDGAVTLTLQQDYAASEVDATINGLVGSLTAVNAKHDSGATSATNPDYQANYLVSQYTPIAGNVGDLETFNVTWPRSGALTRATS